MRKNYELSSNDINLLKLLRNNPDVLKKVIAALDKSSARPAYARVKRVVETAFPKEAKININWNDVTRLLKEYTAASRTKPQNITVGDPDYIIEAEPIPTEGEPLTIPEEWPEEAPAEPEPTPEKAPEKEREPVPAGSWDSLAPMNITVGDPDYIIEAEPIPTEDEPLTVPEEWPEEAPAEPEKAPAKEREPVKVGAKDVPIKKLDNPFAWKILNVGEDGTLYSPHQGTEWPVGKPLVAPVYDYEHARRGSAGIHLCDESHWGEFPQYYQEGNSVLVKCKLLGSNTDETAPEFDAPVHQDNHVIIAKAARPVLAVSPNRELLLKVANKYAIDTELVTADVGSLEGLRAHELVYQGTTSYGSFSVYKVSGTQYKEFNFSQNALGVENLYFVGESDGNAPERISKTAAMPGVAALMRCTDRCHSVKDVEVYEPGGENFIADFVNNYLRGQKGIYPVWDIEKRPPSKINQKTIPNRRSPMNITNYRQLLEVDEVIKRNIKDLSGFVETMTSNEIDLESADEYGIFSFQQEVTYEEPEKVILGSDQWLELVTDSVDYILNNGYTPEEEAVAKALADVPVFLMNPDNPFQSYDGNFERDMDTAVQYIRNTIEQVEQQGGFAQALNTFLSTLINAAQYFGGNPGQQTLFGDDQYKTQSIPEVLTRFKISRIIVWEEDMTDAEQF